MRAVLCLLLLAVLTGCAGADAAGGGLTDEANRQAVAEVVAELGRDAAVVRASGGYSTRMVDRGRVDLGLVVDAGTPAATREALLDRAEQLFWTSPVAPVNTLNVVLVEQGAPRGQLAGERLYQGRHELAELERVHGPRGL